MNNDIILEKISYHTLIPLGIPAHKSTTTSNATIPFNYSISGTVPDFIDFEIQTKGTTLFKERVDKTKLSVGMQNWEWDGFNSNGIFSSKALKENPLELVASAHFGAKVVSAKQTFEFKHAQHSWVDIVIDKNTKKIDVELRLNIKDGGDHGINKLPPKVVTDDPAYKNLPEATVKHQRVRSFTALKMLAATGIKKYWSRAISLSSGDIYQLTTDVTFATKYAMDDIALVYNTNNNWVRSSNPGRIRGALSLFGNLIARERIAYNVGFVKASQGWFLINTQSADNDFQHTAAHELGHEILSAYGGDTYSYTHRGSSTITQATKSVANGGFVFPAQGEIDLMKYYNGSIGGAYYRRSVASNYDVRSLVYLGGVEIK